MNQGAARRAQPMVRSKLVPPSAHSLTDISRCAKPATNGRAQLGHPAPTGSIRKVPAKAFALLNGARSVSGGRPRQFICPLIHQSQFTHIVTNPSSRPGSRGCSTLTFRPPIGMSGLLGLLQQFPNPLQDLYITRYAERTSFYVYFMRHTLISALQWRRVPLLFMTIVSAHVQCLPL